MNERQNSNLLIEILTKYTLNFPYLFNLNDDNHTYFTIQRQISEAMITGYTVDILSTVDKMGINTYHCPM